MITLKAISKGKTRRINRAPSGKEYIMEGFLEPGLVSYEDCGAGVSRLDKPAIDKMLNSFIGCPLVIEHTDFPKNEVLNGKKDENGEPLKVGEVTRAWWNAETGKYDCAFIPEHPRAINKIKEGWSGSCAYNVKEPLGAGGELHAMRYDNTILDGEFEHLALVPNPRYEDCAIRMNGKAAKIKDNSKEGNYFRLEERIKKSTDMFSIKDELTGEYKAGNLSDNEYMELMKMATFKKNAKMVCIECGAEFKSSKPDVTTQCPKCHGYDIEVGNSKENGKKNFEELKSALGKMNSEEAHFAIKEAHVKDLITFEEMNELWIMADRKQNATAEFREGDKITVKSTGKKATVSKVYKIAQEYRYDLEYADGGRAEGFLEGTLETNKNGKKNTVTLKKKSNASRDEVVRQLKLMGVPLTEKNIKWEMRVQQLEDEGCDRSDAQGIADVELGSTLNSKMVTLKNADTFKVGDKVKIKKEWQDAGDEGLIFSVVEWNIDRGMIQCESNTMSIKPTHLVQGNMIQKA